MIYEEPLADKAKTTSSRLSTRASFTGSCMSDMAEQFKEAIAEHAVIQ